jgi:osmotically-inducible protein OsmY
VDDKKLEVQVHVALSLNKNLHGLDFAVKSFKREVTLSGEVATAEQRALALSVAKDIPGVLRVKDVLRVRGNEGGKS